MSELDIRGVIPPMITPFKENGDVDYGSHSHNMEMWNETELRGYLVLGSNSEAVYLNEEEKLKMVRLTVRQAKQGRTVIAGTGMESTRETIKLTNKISDEGAQAALILTPFYYGGKMTDDALIKYFSDVADKVSIPVLIYNVAKFTHINISTKAVSVLSRHSNIIGMKDSSGNVPQLAAFRAAAANDFNLIVGTASAWYPALTLGIKGGIMALANIAPRECAEVQKLYEEGNHASAVRLYERLLPVNTAVTATFGVAGLKHAANLLGYRGGMVRGPLLPAKEHEKEQIREILIRSGILDG